MFPSSSNHSYWPCPWGFVPSHSPSYIWRKNKTPINFRQQLYPFYSLEWRGLNHTQLLNADCFLSFFCRNHCKFQKTHRNKFNNLPARGCTHITLTYMHKTATRVCLPAALASHHHFPTKKYRGCTHITLIGTKHATHVCLPAALAVHHHARSFFHQEITKCEKRPQATRCWSLACCPSLPGIRMTCVPRNGNPSSA